MIDQNGRDAARRVSTCGNYMFISPTQLYANEIHSDVGGYFGNGSQGEIVCYSL